MVDNSITLRDVGKRYEIAHEREPYGRLSETITEVALGALRGRRGSRGRTNEPFWAIRDVSFDVRQGEVVGIIGPNGAGKSTLLKVLSRITEPTTGRIELRGQVASLLEVGTGFHNELTGRENIYLSGAILGMGRQETRRRFDEIVAFAGVERFLDTPVKRYSSGMLVRLGFAVAAHLEPDILIVDEVLAVGDAAFQRMSLAKMEDVSRAGRTVLFVSHNIPSVEGLCTRAILLEGGAAVMDGRVRDVVRAYLNRGFERAETPIAERTDRRGSGLVRVASIRCSIQTGADSSISVEYSAVDEPRNVEFEIYVFSARGEFIASLSTQLTGTSFARLPSSGSVVCELPRAAIMPGRYKLNVKVRANGTVADWLQDAASFEVGPGDYFGTGRLPPEAQAPVVTDHRWRIGDQ